MPCCGDLASAGLQGASIFSCFFRLFLDSFLVKNRIFPGQHQHFHWHERVAAPYRRCVHHAPEKYKRHPKQVVIETKLRICFTKFFEDLICYCGCFFV
jgi:hypothetical protein